MEKRAWAWKQLLFEENGRIFLYYWCWCGLEVFIWILIFFIGAIFITQTLKNDHGISRREVQWIHMQQSKWINAMMATFQLACLATRQICSHIVPSFTQGNPQPTYSSWMTLGKVQGDYLQKEAIVVRTPTNLVLPISIIKLVQLQQRFMLVVAWESSFFFKPH